MDDKVTITRKEYDRLLKLEQKACDVVNIMSNVFHVPSAVRSALNDIIRLVNN